jgi:hypothetical protein
MPAVSATAIKTASVMSAAKSPAIVVSLLPMIMGFGRWELGVG